MVWIELAPTKRCAEPMQLRDVPNDEHKGDHAGGPLQRVTHVADIGVGTDIGKAVGDDHEPHHRVKEHWQEDERPLDRHEQRPQRVDHVHAGLERARPGEHGGIREQVDNQKGPDRNEARQREQPVDQKLVTGQE